MMVRPKNQHKYKQYEERFTVDPTTQFEAMFAAAPKSSSSKKDATKSSTFNVNSVHYKKEKKERSGWERKEDKTHYNEQALANKSKSKADKPLTGGKHRNYPEQHPCNHKPKTYVEEDNEKDTDDSEEFFQLIRETVADSVKKTMKEMLDKNIRGLFVKVDEIADELKQTQSKVEKLQNEVAAKVVHYGEENSRHFRYLCMKSEYDKLFYQHQNMVQYTPNQQQQSTPVQSKESVLFTHRVSSQSNGFPTDVDLNLPPNSNAFCAMCTTRDGKPLHSQADAQKNFPTNSELALKEIIDQIQKVYPKATPHPRPCSKMVAKASPKYEVREEEEDTSSPAFDDNNSDEINM